MNVTEKFVKGTGIVCEYNPFHKGHAYQIQKVKEMGASFVVCAMSGDFTQRGEPAFQDKRVRAENAVKNGADIVLEVPFPFCSLSAEGFARAGISVLENSGLCDSFAFGSECADTDKLLTVARLLDKDFHKKVIARQKESPNLGYASARQELVLENLGSEYADILANPNDILGIEYLKANKSLCPVAIKRETPRGGYDEKFVSSSYIRKNLFDDENGSVAKGGLADNVSLEGIYDNNELFYKHLLVSLAQMSPDRLREIAEVPSGSEYAIVRSAIKAQSYDELCTLLSSKTFTDAKIRRMLLFSLLAVTKKMSASQPLYAEVLASSELGKKMLKKYAQDRKIIVASRVSQIKESKEALTQYEFSRLASLVVEKCRRISH